MPLLLRRSAPTSTVEELAGGYRKDMRKSSRRISAPEEPRTNDVSYYRTPSRSEPAEYMHDASGNLVEEPSIPDDKSIAQQEKVLSLASIVNHPNLVNSLAFELNRLPKTYFRLCWDRVVTSVRSSVSSVRTTRQKKQAKVTSDLVSSPKSAPPSSTTSAASNLSSSKTFED